MYATRDGVSLTGQFTKEVEVEFQPIDWKPNSMEQELVLQKIQSKIKSENAYAIYWISIFLHEYLYGEWNRHVPDVSVLEDKSALCDGYEETSYFHSEHEKFGVNVLECGHYYLPELFVFLEYRYVSQTIECLLSNSAAGMYLPTFPALAEDRMDIEDFD